MLYSRGRRIVILAEIEPCGKWMMQAMSWLTRDAVNCAPPSTHNSHTKLHVLQCGLVVWGPMVQCSGVWPWCETRVALDMLLLGLC